jgi:hypothetical protein
MCTLNHFPFPALVRTGAQRLLNYHVYREKDFYYEYFSMREDKVCVQTQQREDKNIYQNFHIIKFKAKAEAVPLHTMEVLWGRRSIAHAHS